LGLVSEDEERGIVFSPQVDDRKQTVDHRLLRGSRTRLFRGCEVSRWPRDGSSLPSAKSPGREVGFKASLARRSSSPVPIDLEWAECDRCVGEFLLAQLDRFAKALFHFAGILRGEVGQPRNALPPSLVSQAEEAVTAPRMDD
jgi:hypothetical protein